MAIMLITHAMGVVAENAQRVVVMYAGKVVEEAPVDELFANPRHPYTQGLIRSIPRVDAQVQGRVRLAQIRGTVPSLLNPPSGCRFADRCSFTIDALPGCGAAACLGGTGSQSGLHPSRRCLTPSSRVRGPEEAFPDPRRRAGARGRSACMRWMA